MLRSACGRQVAVRICAFSRSTKYRHVSTASRCTRPTVQSISRVLPITTRIPLVSRLQRRYYAEVVIKVPEMAESISEGTLKQWSKSTGDYVERDEEIATIETDKIDVSVNAPEAGTLTEFMAQEEDTVTVGQEIAKMDSGGAPGGNKQDTSKSEAKQSASQVSQSTSQQTGDQPETTSRDPAPEKAQQSQAEGKADQGSGAAKEDMKQRSPQKDTKISQSKEQSKPKEQPPKEQSKPDSKDKKSAEPSATSAREERRVKMNRMRLRIAERLKQSQNTAASLTTFQKVDMHSLMEFRKMYKDEILKRTGVKLGFMSAFTRASILAMKDVPTVNASIEGPGGGDTIVYRDYVDVSVAVATEKGLVTPVVRNAEALDLIGIESAIAELGKKARDNKLTIEDMAGGTYTISNGGVFGSLFGTPIINLPQTAVLGLHAINDEVVVIDGKFEARPIMYLALTYDHRLLDGREAVTFLVKPLFGCSQDLLYLRPQRLNSTSKILDACF